ncbi:MAG TPA: trypsin-like peptidase domain-containing protein [Methylotenera sp.]|nr:trypsin-like peptidase domain-containing protein [Methylotenera sp.]
MMTRLIVALSCFMVATASLAMPTDEIVQKVSAHVVKVQVALSNGGFGLGSGVVIAKDQVVTNCHVVANALSVSINANGENYNATSLKPDWHHDLCILRVSGLDAPIAHMGSSENLKYEQPVYSVGFASLSPRPNGTFGYIKGLYPMDDSVIVRASNTFRLGDSGGGLFDEVGDLVGIITVKSPGHNAYYYNMPVEWVQRLLSQPEQSLASASELPFWAESEDKWPFFMRIVQPLKTENWEALNAIATAWNEREPNTTEALFYRALAEYRLKNEINAEAYFNQVVAKNGKNSSALYYLGLIAENSGKHMEALNLVAILDNLDASTARDLKLAMGITE